jgi:hypothetical protein
MSNKLSVAVLGAVAAAAGAAWLATRQHAAPQNATQAVASATVLTPVAGLSGMRDWSGGLWVKDTDPERGDVGTMRGDTLPLTPLWRRKSDALNQIREAGGALPANESQCIPSGMPYMMIANALEFIYTPGRIGILGGSRGIQIRNIYTNGRAHTADEFLFDSYSGESIGHWDGDTLVVDTIAMRSTNEMIYALKGSKLSVLERMRLSAPDRLEITTTLTDAKALTKPWTYVNTFRKHPDQFTTESGYCVAAYDRTVDPRTGEQGFDLTPPPEEGIGLPQSLSKH